MWNIVNKLVFLFLINQSCEAFPSVDNPSKSVSRKPSDRSVLINLAKTLSSSLQKAMTANNQKIENILGDQQEVMAAVEKIEAEVHEIKKSGLTSDKSFIRLKDDVKALKERRNLDEMLWKFNTQVCNASIKMIKQEIDTKLSEFKSDKIVITNENKKTLSEESFLGESFTNDIFDTDNIFKEFEDALAEYEDQDDYYRESQSEKLSEKEVTDPVGNLVAETNKLLTGLETKYSSLSDEIKTLQNLTAEPKPVVDPELENKMNSRMLKLEAKFDFLLKNLQSIMEGADDDIRHDINMRMEDFNVLRKTTTSRLSVYETRIDMLEQLVLKYATKTTEPSINLFETTTETSPKPPQTTEMPDPAYDDFGGNDFSMLGISNAKDLDTVPSYQQAGETYVQDTPKSDSKYFDKDKIVPIMSPSKPNFGSLSPTPTFPSPRATRNENGLPETCDCEEIRVKALTLDHEMKFLSAEVGSAVAGMRSSLTALLHRIEAIEKESRNVQQVSCVATKEALKMPGMDAWCSENCRKGKCPSHLCSCPTTIN